MTQVDSTHTALLRQNADCARCSLQMVQTGQVLTMDVDDYRWVQFLHTSTDVEIVVV